MVSNQEAKMLQDKVAEGAAHGLTDAEIADYLMAVGSDTHVAFGRLVKPGDLVSVIRQGLTATPVPEEWVPAEVDEKPATISIRPTGEGVTFDVWEADAAGHAVGDEPIHTGYMLTDDILEYVGAAPKDGVVREGLMGALAGTGGLEIDMEGFQGDCSSVEEAIVRKALEVGGHGYEGIAYEPYRGEFEATPFHGAHLKLFYDVVAFEDIYQPEQFDWHLTPIAVFEAEVPVCHFALLFEGRPVASGAGGFNAPRNWDRTELARHIRGVNAAIEAQAFEERAAEAEAEG